jgi:hypothetical protein
VDDTQAKSEAFFLLNKNLSDTQAKLDRTHQLFQKRIDCLEKVLEDYRVKLNEIVKEINKIQSAPKANQSQSETQPQLPGAPAPPAVNVKGSPQQQINSKPIDRNGVAPSQVSIEKMFYCGNKRF